MIESDLIRTALKEATARNEALEQELSCSQKREVQLRARILSIEDANDAFLEGKNKIINSLTSDREEEAERAVRAEGEARRIQAELDTKKKQLDSLAKKYDKMCLAMSALQRVVSETVEDNGPTPLPLPLADSLESNDFAPAPSYGKTKSRVAMRESAELCLTTFKDLSQALYDAGIKASVNTKADGPPLPSTKHKSLPQPSMQRIKSRAKPSTHDLVAAALQGHVSESLAFEANAVFSRQEDAAPAFKLGSAQAAVAQAAVSDLTTRDQ